MGPYTYSWVAAHKLLMTPRGERERERITSMPAT
jgi:hypothetical protein